MINRIRHIFFGLTLLLFLFLTGTASASTIEATLDKEEAWVGEGISLLITLRAPGPFSGTASFELPETGHTFFIKEGNPLVGSETIQGVTWLTQKHQFRVYTQDSGDVVIPPIRVRFEAKKDYTSAPEPYSGSTEAQHVQSRRPPGATGMVISAQEMLVQQAWSTFPENGLKPGDVIIRSVTRTANKTTGMIFSDADLSLSPIHI